MNTAYSRFSREISLMAASDIHIGCQENRLILQRGKVVKSDGDQVFNAIEHYFKNYHCFCKKPDTEKLESIRNKLLETSDEATHERIKGLFADLIRQAEGAPEKMAKSDAAPRLDNILVKVADAPENAPAFQNNLLLVINNYPRFQLGENLEIYDTAFGNLPENWDLKKVYSNLKKAFREFQEELGLSFLEAECDRLMKPLIPIQMGLIIETSPLNPNSEAMYVDFCRLEENLKPIIVNRHFLAVYEWKLNFRQDIEIYCQPQGNLAVILPKGKSLEECGFSAQHLVKASLKEAKSTVIKEEVAEDLKDILIDETEEGRFARIVYFTGHGSYPGFPGAFDPSKEGTIGGLPVAEFQKTYQVLNPVFFGGESCFWGGHNIHQTHLPDGAITCPIMIFSSLESVSTAEEDSCAVPLLAVAEKLLFQEQTRAAPRQLQLGELQRSVSKLAEQRKIQNLPQILLPANRRDIPKVTYRGFETQDVVDVSRRHSQKVREGTGDRNIYLFSDPVVMEPIIIKGTLPAILLSRGGTSHHYADCIKAEGQELAKIAELTFNVALNTAGSDVKAASKAFFISALTCQINGKDKLLHPVMFKETSSECSVIYKIVGEPHFRWLKFSKKVFVNEKNKKKTVKWEKDQEVLLSSFGAVFSIYETMIKTRPTQQHLLNTTAGRQSEEDFLEAFEQNFWKKNRPIEADLYATILHNQKLFLKGEGKKVFWMGAFDRALALFKSCPKYSPANKDDILRLASTLASVSGQKALEGAINGTKYTPLMFMVTRGNLSEVQSIYSRCPGGLDAVDLWGSNALLLALSYRKSEVAQFLINCGCKMDLANRKGMTPVHWVIQQSDKEMLTYMIERGLNIKGAFGSKLLSFALSLKNYDMFAFLIAQGVGGAETLLWEVCSCTSDDTIIGQLLREQKVDVNEQKGKAHTTALHLCVHRGNVQGARALLDHKAKMDVVDGHGFLPIHYAASSRNEHAVDCIDLLSEFKADLNAKAEKGKTALHLAIADKNMAAIVKLIENGASLDIEDDKYQTALELAYQDKEILFHILKLKNVNINHSSPNHPPLLLKALIKDDLVLAEALVSSGADVNIIYSDVPLLLCLLKMYRPSLDAIQFLLARADLRKTDEKGNTALHQAVLSAPHDVFMRVLDAGIPMDIKNSENNTAFMAYAQETHYELSKWASLIEKTNSLTEEEVKVIAKTGLKRSYARAFFEKFVISGEAEENSLKALHRAIFNSDLDGVSRWLGDDPKVTNTAICGIPALHSVLYFAERDQEELLELLLNNTPEKDAEDVAGNTLLSIALFRNLPLAHELIQRIEINCSVDMPYIVNDPELVKVAYARHPEFFAGEQGTNALRAAIFRNDHETVDYLIDAKAGREDPKFATTVLPSFFYQKRKGLLARALEYPNIDINQTGWYSPLLQALRTDDPEIVDLVLAKDPDVDLQNSLHELAEPQDPPLVNQIPIAQKLLAKGADINRTHKKLNTALHVALQNDNSSLALFLIEHGADFTLPNKKGQTALQIAEIGRLGEVVDAINKKLHS